MTVGDRLRQLREEHGLTLEAAGRIAGTTKQSASQIEKGVTKAPGGIFLYRWSRHYGVSLEWLITGKGERTTASQYGRPDFDTMAAAVKLLRDHLDLMGDPPVLITDPGMLEDAYEVIVAHQGLAEETNVIDLATMLAKRKRQGAVDGGRTSRSGSKAG